MLHLYYHTPSYTHTYCTVCTVCVCCYTHTSRRKRKQRGANVQSIFRRTETKTNWFHIRRRRKRRHWLRHPALVCRCSHICSYYKVPWVSEVLQRDPGLWHRLSKHTVHVRAKEEMHEWKLSRKSEFREKGERAVTEREEREMSWNGLISDINIIPHVPPTMPVSNLMIIISLLIH